MSTKIITRFRCKEDLDFFMGKFTNENIPRETKEITFNKEGIVHLKLGKPKKDEQKITPKVMKYLQHWKDMPEFKVRFHKSDYAKIDIFFEDYIIEELKELYEQTVTEKTKSLWYPKLIQGEHRNIRVLGGRQAKYPIFVVTKNRSEEYRFATSNWLSRMCQPHYLVVEPEQEQMYKESKVGQSPYATVLVMDMSYKDKYDCCAGPEITKGRTGPGAARNFCADFARNLGVDWCWILDDNSENFDRYWRGRRILAHTPEVFRSVEEFVERFDNIGIAGLNYSKFCVGEQVYPPYTTNTRIYSYGLWNLNCPQITQRGTWNEDTIQSLDILKAGWCTVQFNCWLGAKVTTQKIQGGNTEEFYNKDEDGTRPKSEMLANVHPDVAKVVWKFNRVHHTVDYSGYTQELHYKPEFEYLKNEPFTFNEKNTYIVRIPREMCLTEEDNRKTLEEMFPRGCKEDITNSNIYL